MALRLRVEIMSHEGAVFSGLCERFVVPALSGEICVLPRHAPLLTTLRPGLARVCTEGEPERAFFLTSGFLEIQPDLVTVLADTAYRSRELDEQQVLAAKQRTEQALAHQAPGQDHARLMNELRLEVALLRAIGELRKRERG